MKNYSAFDVNLLTPQSIRDRWFPKDSLASEDACLTLIDTLFPSTHPHNPMGRGDDCAIVTMPTHVAISTDSFLEDSHFRTSYFSPREVGAKALASAVSDIGAAGAIPLGFSLDLMIPANMGTATLRELMEGMAHVAKHHDILLTGGDTAKSDKLGICVTVWGKSVSNQENFFLNRAVARPHDTIFCAGALGLAKAGLLLLEKQGRPALEKFPLACQSHLWPEALTTQGEAISRFAIQYPSPIFDSGTSDMENLGTKRSEAKTPSTQKTDTPKPHTQLHDTNKPTTDSLSMEPPVTGSIGLMDVSDGLAQDIPRLLGMKKTASSPLGADLSFSLDAIPQELHLAAKELNTSAEYLMLSGGEDYALLGTCPAPLWAALQQAVPEVYSIGAVTTNNAITYQGKDFKVNGFDHFGVKI